MTPRPTTPAAREALRRRAARARESGRTDLAERLYRALVAADPADGDALHWLGALHLLRGDTATARTLLERASALRPCDPQCLYHCGEACRAVGDPAAAVPFYRRAARLAPGIAAPRRALGLALGALGRWKEAAAAFGEALRLSSGDVKLRLEALHALAMAGEEAWARALLQELEAEGVPAARLADTLAAVAAAIAESGRPEAAVAWWREALRLDSGRARRWNDFGLVLQRLGRFAEAEDAFRRALALDPGLMVARQNLALIADRPVQDAEIAALARALAATTDEDARIRGLYALGRLHERAGDYGAAVAALREANRLKRTRAPFDAAAHEAFVDRLIALCDAAFFHEREGWGAPSDLPVLVVGMPRSGTTLVERILAAHPEVTAGGERDDLRDLAARLPEFGPGVRPFPEGVADLDRDGARRLATAYLEALTPLAGAGVRHVTDKLPGNFVRLAMVGLALPRVRIVWCRRDPRDVCISCFATDFARGLRFATDPADCARVWRAHARLLAHWQQVLPNPLLVVDYERLVDDPEGQTGRLLRFLDLRPEPACLRFFEQEGDVRTPSVWQVRQPVYRHAVGRWRRFAPHLPGFTELFAGIVPPCHADPSS